MCADTPPVWRKSSRSLVNNCVEVAAPFRKSSYSSDTANCVEVATDGLVHVRDSKDVGGPVLLFQTAEWRRWLAAAKAGGFDRT